MGRSGTSAAMHSVMPRTFVVSNGTVVDRSPGGVGSVAPFAAIPTGLMALVCDGAADQGLEREREWL